MAGPPSPPSPWIKDGTGIKTRDNITSISGPKASGTEDGLMSKEDKAKLNTVGGAGVESDPIVGGINGIVKANGSGTISAATSGTDYAPGTAGLATGIIKSTTTTGSLSVATASDFPTLNQNTSGTAAGLSTTLAIGSGGTGQTTAQNAINALTSASSATNEHVLTKDTATGNAVFKEVPVGEGHSSVTLDTNADSVLSLTGQEVGLDPQVTKTFLSGPTSGADAVPTFRTIAAEDVPTLNQNTSGSAASLSSTLAVASGGTGQTTEQAAINALTAVSGATNEHVLTKDTATGNVVFKAAPSGSGDVVAPATNTSNNIPQWDGENSKTLKDGLAVVTTLGSPGADTNIATEAAVRSAISNAGGGDFTGPASAVDSNLVAFDGVGGKTGKDSGVALSEVVVSTTITALVALTQAQYNALSPVVETTLYIITDSQKILLGSIEVGRI